MKTMIILFLLILPCSLLSAEIDSKFESFAQNTTKKNDVKAFNNSISSEFSHDMGKISFELGMEMAHDFIDENEIEGEFELDAANVTYTPLDSLEFTIGRKTISWGKADEFNPADFLAPEDLRYFIFKEKGERVLPNNIIQAKVSFGDSSITGVMVPLQREGKLPDRKSIWQTRDMRDLYNTAGVVIHNNREEKTPFKKNQYAVKVSSDFSGVDVDLIYFSGFHLIPEYKKSISGTTINIQEDYKRFQGLGMGISGAYKAYTFRFEGATKDRISLLRNGTSSNIDRAMYQINAGMDWTDGEKVLINVQYVLSEIMKYSDGITVARLSDFLFVQYKTSFFDEKLEVKFRAGNAVMSDDGAVFNPESSYIFLENYVATLGAYVFGGTNNRGLFSQYDDNDMIYAKFKAVF